MKLKTGDRVIAYVSKHGYNNTKTMGYTLYEADSKTKTGYKFVKNVYGMPLKNVNKINTVYYGGKEYPLIKGRPIKNYNAPNVE